MFKFFSFITDIIGTVVNLVVSTFQMLGVVFRLIGQGLSLVLDFLTVFPPHIVVLFTACVCYMVVINVLNKGG